ncbi:hypothetical protein HanRHA438_Chr15g0694541 [Helianthus annuus]|nr:hypothetical protein HanIR_Chr15g0741311 [Helianthus annuus]KAJ0638707.1 hypothetical protein HanHA300_Chr00c0055g0700031 [Helianthus annuus]KAJ0830352.1 hypothetical protein HanPSC8_Chr15g0654451 [Helianthus annuus]KAJ0843728.1 hypothetical protein HanRHA438_Chr15g0694541 [Helianthus annuus]
MDFNLVKNRRKWIILIAALGFTTYGAIRVYNSPIFMKKRERFVKTLSAIASVAELLGDSAETIGVVSKDLREFIQSDSDEIPNSLRQLSKIAKSDEFSGSVVSVTRALTVGVLRGYRVGVRRGDVNQLNLNSSFADRALDKLFSPAGSGFVSVVVGSFTKNMVLAVCARREVNDVNGSGSPVEKWVDVIAEEKCRKLIGDCIQQFVSTLVTVYLDKTMDVNPYDQILSGLTNPKHDEKVKDLLSSFCNGAVETFVRTSHQVISNSNGKELMRLKTGDSDGFVSKISSTLAGPSNRSLVLDLTGRVTFATVRSFLDFFLEQMSTGVKRKVDVVHGEAVDKGCEVYRYVSTKSCSAMTVCLSVWLHVLSSPWSFASA